MNGWNAVYYLKTKKFSLLTVMSGRLNDDFQLFLKQQYCRKWSWLTITDVRELEKALQRQDKALAEAAAFPMLREKFNALWDNSEEG
ncbi:hypothetical protein [Photorhabdus laumondii]|uniref:hypothetical protein n=1 Tax=Photorhabdus laumondii TaxID=2218628 RepID=UPI003315689F